MIALNFLTNVCLWFARKDLARSTTPRYSLRPQIDETHGARQRRRKYCVHGTGKLPSIFISHDLSRKVRFTKSISIRAAVFGKNAPKYSASSFSILRVASTRGNFSHVILRCGYRFALIFDRSATGMSFFIWPQFDKRRASRRSSGANQRLRSACPRASARYAENVRQLPIYGAKNAE